MPSDTAVILRYTAFASVAAATIFYVLGPSFIPDDNFKSKSKHGAVGLSNPGNDCFINSTLQAISASPKLRGHLQGQRQAESTDGHKSPDIIVTAALADILERLHVPESRGKTTSARDFIKALELAFNAKLSRQQQDAHELLQFVIQKLDDEAVERSKFNGVKARLPAEGKLESQVECLQCHYRPSPVISTFTVLSLSVPHQVTASLDECFDGIFKQELIQDFVCARCKVEHAIIRKKQQLLRASAETKAVYETDIRRLSEALEKDPEIVLEDSSLFVDISAPKQTITKHTRITHFPKVLLLHLSRSLFGSYSSKNTAKVTFGEHLALGTFDRQKYRLVSVVTHRGGHNSGHYETFRRKTLEQIANPEAPPDTDPSTFPTEPGKRSKRARSGSLWWGISDDKVHECQPHDVLALQRECYMLFYEMVETEPQMESKESHLHEKDLITASS